MRCLGDLRGWFVAMVLAAVCCALLGQGEGARPKRIHLILKDGSYQVVTGYTVVGDKVQYTSAERDGEQEAVPLVLVDLDATHRWEQSHAAGGDPGGKAPQIDPELLKEEEDRASLTPLVAPDLRLPEQESVLAFDRWQKTPELVPLVQTDGDLNRSTAHSELKHALNPLAASHQLIELQGDKAAVQLHVATPEFYLRVGDDTTVSSGEAPVTVDTHGASSAAINNEDKKTDAGASRYVIVRADVRVDARIIASFSTTFQGKTSQQEDVVATTSVLMRGGHWLKLTPSEPLLPGEYALMELTSETEVNLGVWDFGLHPAAGENRDAIKPQAKKPAELERRAPE